MEPPVTPVFRDRADAGRILAAELAGYAGRSDVIVRDGKLDETLARHNRLSEHDLLEDFRLNGNVRDMREVALAVFERNGHVSVVRREHQ